MAFFAFVLRKVEGDIVASCMKKQMLVCRSDFNLTVDAIEFVGLKADLRYWIFSINHKHFSQIIGKRVLLLTSSMTAYVRVSRSPLSWVRVLP